MSEFSLKTNVFATYIINTSAIILRIGTYAISSFVKKTRSLFSTTRDIYNDTCAHAVMATRGGDFNDRTAIQNPSPPQHRTVTRSRNVAGTFAPLPIQSTDDIYCTRGHESGVQRHASSASQYIIYSYIILYYCILYIIYFIGGRYTRRRWSLRGRLRCCSVVAEGGKKPIVRKRHRWTHKERKNMRCVVYEHNTLRNSASDYSTDKSDCLQPGNTRVYHRDSHTRIGRHL